MTNAELIAKIKAEIERLIEESDFDESANLYSLLSFLSTLEESVKPMNLDLEIEIEDYIEQRWEFAENLNAAVPVYLYDMTLDELKDCARHFAQWQKEQMLEDAVEADVNTYRDLAAGKSWAEFVVEMPTNNLGDKVSVIVLPKEDDR